MKRHVEMGPKQSGGAGSTAGLAEKLEQLSLALERANVADYITLVQHPWRLIWVNLLAGAARGLGIAIGFTVLGAVLLKILQSTLMQNLPGIGQLIADIVKLVQLNMR